MYENEQTPTVAIPVVVCIIFSLVWLAAGQSFFADYLIPIKSSDTLDEAVANARIKSGTYVAASVTRQWMDDHLMCWPEYRVLNFWSVLSYFSHPFLHAGLLCSVCMISGFTLLGFLVELRNGGSHLMKILFFGLIVNAIAIYKLTPEGPVFGSWPLIVAMSASLVCGSTGNFLPIEALLVRLVGFAVLAAFYLNWFGYLFGVSIEWTQWLPTTVLGAVLGLSTWVFGELV